MRPIRSYLLIHSEEGWKSTVHRDYESLLEAWEEHSGRKDVSGVIHVGLDRPETEEFNIFILKYPGCILMTASARWALLSICECASNPIGAVAGIPLYVAISGWGYKKNAEEIVNSDFEFVGSEKTLSPSAPFTDLLSNNWLDNLFYDDPELAILTHNAQIVNESTYWENEVNLPVQSRHTLGLYRYHALSKNDDPDDPIEIIHHGPPWLLSIEIGNINLKIRTIHALRTMNFSVIRDISSISLPKLQRIPNFGRTSQLDMVQQLRDALERGPSIISPNFTPSATDLLSNNWLDDLLHDDPELAIITRNAQIASESTYWENEANLPVQPRHALGLYRYNALSKNDEPEDPIKIINHGPPWLLSIDIGNINLKVRTLNALRSKNFSAVKDISNISLQELQRTPNFGRNSQFDLVQQLRDALARGPSIVGSNLLPSANTHSLNTVTLDSTTNGQLGSKFSNHGTLPLAILAAVTSLDQNYETAVSGRMGLGVAVATLEDLGRQMGITRERVRQLEKKAMLQICRDQIWKDVLEVKLSKLIDEREDPLAFSGLAILDSWFQGIEQMQDPFMYLLEHKYILDQRFSLIKANGQWFVTRLSQPEWDLALKQAMQLLESGVVQGWHQGEARQNVESLISDKGHELRSELWIAAKQFAHFSTTNVGEDPVLVSYGKGPAALVEAILSESDRPLHYSEIPQQIETRYGRKVDVRRTHNIAGDIALLYGKGYYGLIKHCPLNIQEREIVREEVLDIMSNNVNGRQWSCAELLVTLNERGVNFGERLDTYTLNISLLESSMFKSLGRYLFQSASDADENSQRIDIRQAVTALLMQAGKPLSNSEIKEALKKDRGISRTFQIFPSGSIISVGKGIWGLIERDLLLSADEQTQLIGVLEKLLRDRNSGIHISEIIPCLEGNFEPISRINDPEVLFAVAQRSELIRKSPGGYLFLSEWGGTRRISKSQAVFEVLRRAGEHGLTAVEIVKYASDILGREIPKEGIYVDVTSAGAKFDEDKKRWVITSKSDDAEEPDDA